LIQDCKENLAREFEMKDMGLMHYFLGLEVWQGDGEIFMGKGHIFSRDFICRIEGPWPHL